MPQSNVELIETGAGGCKTWTEAFAPRGEGEGCVAPGRRSSSNHITNDKATGRAALAPTSRATSTPIKEEGSAGSALAPVVSLTSRATSSPIKKKGSAGSAPAPVVAYTTGYVRQGDNDTEDKNVRQGDNDTEDKKGQGNINIVDHKKLKDTDAINKIIEEIIKNNEELENTIDKMIIKDGTDYDNDIIDMLNNMMEQKVNSKSISLSKQVGPLRRPEVGPLRRPEVGPLRRP